ncbi:MAG: HDIG domain-containing protein [Brevinematales bacterium]|nr:HDIG domain-containing protein [Brevinematales bacterium]
MERNNEALDIPFIKWLFKEKKILVLFSVTYLISFVLIILSNLPPLKKDFLLEDNAQKSILSDENISFINKIELNDRIKEISYSLPYYYRYDENHYQRFSSNIIKFFNLVLTENANLKNSLLNKGFIFSDETIDFLSQRKSYITNYINRINYLYEAFVSKYVIVDKLIPEQTNYSIIKATGIENLRYEKILFYPVDKELISSFISKIFPSITLKENLFYSELLAFHILPTATIDEKIREARLKEAVESLIDRKSYIGYKEIIIKKGEKINHEKYSKIMAYIDYKWQNFFKKMFFYFILSFLIFILIIYRFYTFDRHEFQKSRNVIISIYGFIIANLFFYFSSFFYREYNNIELFLFIPYGVITSLLPILLIKQKTSFILLITYTFFSFFYPFFDVYSFFNLLILSFLTIYSSKLLNKRGDFFILGILISAFEIFYVLSYILLHQNFSAMKILVNVLFGFGNGMVSAIFSLGILPFIEDIFVIPTHFKLLELSNISTSKLLKEFRNEAQGTYNHSIMLGDMCEKAAEAIGEDPLLVKVGAYYHDIGKMKNPEYFIENQMGENRHNEMKVSMSVSVIKSHIKLGVEMAKENKIPEEIIDFIREHHGTTTISYFYHQAVNLYGDENINISDYQYNGPKPKSKATAILMLADSIEATLRAYSQNAEKINTAIIEDIVNDVTEKRIEQGQLEECNITLREINLIKEEFVKFLTSYYHKRIDYKTEK